MRWNKKKFLDENGLSDLVDLMMQQNEELDAKITEMLRQGNILVASKRIEGTFWAYRYLLGIVEFHYDSRKGLAPGSNIIGTLPVGFRPKDSWYYPTSTGNTYDCRLIIGSDGTISVYNYNSGNANNVLLSGMYITADPLPG